MRKAQKQQIEEIIRQMAEVHNELKGCIEEGIAIQAQELLTGCQNAAIAIGTLIENLEGEGHPAVTILEEYCEQVYQIYTNLSADGINADKIYKSLMQKLVKAQNCIRNDIKIRREAVFLPYKASMWDSLESVWRAADADPDCDAYVIPIPYFDKNPDGSFREEHYEGGQYPDYVPITKYDEFDFGKHMPDAIYIHNGYDEWNLVTSVHPFFYSKNLKKFTECLVYIPYFVIAEPNPDNDAVVENIGHFCTIPGVFNADRVIVQSEATKKVYVKALMKATEDYSGAVRKYWDNKIKGIGSPKFDRLANIRREDVEIPKEWLRIINKPDGTPKKIIFYNTHLNLLMQGSYERFIPKLKKVLEFFKGREDVALLWRPHPLSVATVKSMNPVVLDQYMEILEQYKEEKWGIFDESSDLYRAIWLSDAYYGSVSSVVYLFQYVHKPILIHNINVLEES